MWQPLNTGTDEVRIIMPALPTGEAGDSKWGSLPACKVCDLRESTDARCAIYTTTHDHEQKEATALCKA